MDIARPPEIAQQRRRRRVLIGAAAVMAVAAASIALARLKPSAPTVEGGTLWIDTVKRGTMIRNVRGMGVLVPDEIRWITSLTDGRVERVLVQPGTEVQADTIVLELSNAQAEQTALTAELDLRTARAQYEVLKADLERELLNQRAASADIAAEAARAGMDAEANEAMFKQGLVSAIVVKQSRLKADTAAARQKMEEQRLASTERTLSARLDVQQAEVLRRETLAALRRNEALGLKVRAGVAGVLQEVAVQTGQRIDPGTNLARVADPARLKGQLQIPETQVRDIVVGQKAEIDTRTGVVKGRVIRIDPAARNGTVTVDVALEGELPRGARPDMSVDGTVELDRLDGILYVGRPAFGQERAKVSLFKLSPDGREAALVPVELGRTSVNTVEITGGLAAGDRVVLSDMSVWEGHDRLRLR